MNTWDEMNVNMRKRRMAVLEAAFELFSENSIREIKMEDIAKRAGIGVASVYRYFGTKLALCVELGTLKWKQYTQEMEKAYAAQGVREMNALQEFVFYMGRYIDLYENHKPLLRFNQNFDLFTIQEDAAEEEMADYYESVGYFAKKFHAVYEKAFADHTIRTDIPEMELFFSVMYTMLPTAQKLASGLIYPRDVGNTGMKILERQKEMFINYVKAEELH